MLCLSLQKKSLLFILAVCGENGESFLVRTLQFTKPLIIPMADDLNVELMLEKTLENPLDCKEIQPVHPKRNQSWIVIGRTDAEAPILLMRRDDSLGKTLIMEKREGRRRRGLQRMRWLDGITDFERALGNGDGQGSLACCSPWCHKESDTAEPLNNDYLNVILK